MCGISNKRCVERWIERHHEGSVGLFWGCRINNHTHWSRSGRLPSRHRRCTGTRWLCRYTCPRCGTGYSHNHWCLKMARDVLDLWRDTVWSVVHLDSVLTLMAVGASETLLALAAELAPGLTLTATVRSTNVWWDVTLSSWCAVGCHGNRAAINHCREAIKLNSKTNDFMKGLLQIINKP